MKMDNNDQSRKIDIKNRTRYYLDDVIKNCYFDINNIFIDEKA